MRNTEAPSSLPIFADLAKVALCSSPGLHSFSSSYIRASGPVCPSIGFLARHDDRCGCASGPAAFTTCPSPNPFPDCLNNFRSCQRSFTISNKGQRGRFKCDFKNFRGPHESSILGELRNGQSWTGTLELIRKSWWPHRQTNWLRPKCVESTKEPS